MLLNDPATGSGITEGIADVLCRNLELINPPLRFAAGWTLLRSGATGAFNDTWDGASDIVTAINSTTSSSFAAVGQIYRVRICNTSGFTGTISGGTGITTGAATLAAGSCTNFALELTGTPGSTPTGVTIVGG